MPTSSITDNFVVDKETYERLMSDLKSAPPRDPEKAKEAKRIWEHSQEILKKYPFH